jgi:myosin heavy subunit
MSSEEDDYEDIRLEESEPEPVKKPKRKYNLSEKAKTSRAENLRIGREKRKQNLLKKLQTKNKHKNVIEYTDTETESESSQSEAPKRKHKTHDKKKASSRNNKKESNEMSNKIKELEATIKKLSKQRSRHKTVIVNERQEQRKPSEQATKAKESMLSRFGLL